MWKIFNYQEGQTKNLSILPIKITCLTVAEIFNKSCHHVKLCVCSDNNDCTFFLVALGHWRQKRYQMLIYFLLFLWISHRFHSYWIFEKHFLNLLHCITCWIKRKMKWRVSTSTPLHAIAGEKNFHGWSKSET